MLDQLRFVQGSVGKVNFDSSLAHFKIKDGRVTGWNGTIGISTPIPLDLNCQPNAVQLVKAIRQCENTVSMAMLPGGKLRVSSGKFRAGINCYPEDIPMPTPTGARVEIDGSELVKAFKVLQRFVGTDASRPWATGILLRGSSAFATNNVTLCEYWLGGAILQAVNVPGLAVAEVLRVGRPPTHLTMDENSLSFHYEDGAWIRSSLLVTEWPDLTRILGRKVNAVALPEDLFKGIESLAPFVDELNRIYFMDGRVANTDTGDDSFYEVDGFNHTGIYQINMLRLLDGVAEKADFTDYPNPCIFYGPRLRGAIMGMRAVNLETV